MAEWIAAGHHVDIVTARSKDAEKATRAFLSEHGIPHHGLTMAGRLAALLAEDRSVRRTVIAQSGLTAIGVLGLIRDRSELTTGYSPRWGN